MRLTTRASLVCAGSHPLKPAQLSGPLRHSSQRGDAGEADYYARRWRASTRASGKLDLIRCRGRAGEAGLVAAAMPGNVLPQPQARSGVYRRWRRRSGRLIGMARIPAGLCNGAALRRPRTPAALVNDIKGGPLRAGRAIEAARQWKLYL